MLSVLPANAIFFKSVNDRIWLSFVYSAFLKTAIVIEVTYHTIDWFRYITNFKKLWQNMYNKICHFSHLFIFAFLKM